MNDFLNVTLHTLQSMGEKLGIFSLFFTTVILMFVFLGKRFFPGLTASFADIIRLAKPYFLSKEQGEFSFLGRKTVMNERVFAWGMVILLLLINTFQVELQVIFNEWGRRFYNAIEKKNTVEFWIELNKFLVIAGIHIATAVLEFYLLQMLVMRWRKFMTRTTFGDWLSDNAHYRLSLEGNVDNPDQRISEDVNKFTSSTVNLFLQFYSALLSIFAFTVILWGLSTSYTYKIGDFNLTSIPGYLVWAAVIYILVGTVITHFIGRRLINLDYKREATEANFRFSLARLRENGEPIALLKGEKREEQFFSHSFLNVMSVWYEVVRVRIQMTWFTSFWGQLSVILPYFLLAPAYFASGSTLTIGNLMQTKSALSRVEGSLSIIINLYSTLADYRATINRLTGFAAAILKTKTNPTDINHQTAPALTLKNLFLTLPTGKKLVEVPSLSFEKGEHILVTGPSGSGKSTIFRAIAGLWVYGSGEITTPSNMLLIPQKPYLPIGTLRDALSYPSEVHYDDATLIAALKTVKLEHLTGELDNDKPWHLTLSGGEQQRLSLARAILIKPEWLFLDEATAAMDEPTEALLYTGLKQALPKTTIVSIGHRSTLVNFHDKRINLTKMGEHFIATDAPLMMVKG